MLKITASSILWLRSHASHVLMFRTVRHLSSNPSNETKPVILEDVLAACKKSPINYNKPIKRKHSKLIEGYLQKFSGDAEKFSSAFHQVHSNFPHPYLLAIGLVNFLRLKNYAACNDMLKSMIDKSNIPSQYILSLIRKTNSKHVAFDFGIILIGFSYTMPSNLNPILTQLLSQLLYMLFETNSDDCGTADTAVDTGPMFWQLFHGLITLDSTTIPESIYTMGMKMFLREGDVDGVESLHSLMVNNNVGVSPRSKIQLMVAMVLKQDHRRAVKYLDDICSVEEATKQNEANYLKIILDVLDELALLQSVDRSHLLDLVTTISQSILNYGFSVDSEFKNKILRALETSIDGEDIRVHECTLSTDNICSQCRSPVDIPSLQDTHQLTRLTRHLGVLIKCACVALKTNNIKDFDALKDSMSDIVPTKTRHIDSYFGRQKDAVMETKDSRSFPDLKFYDANTIPDEFFTDLSPRSGNVLSHLARFTEFIHDTGPYDMIVDALNIGYQKAELRDVGSRFDGIKVINAVKKIQLDEPSCKILVICSGPLKQRLLSLPDSKLMDVERDRKDVLIELENLCSCYYVNRELLDDYYMLQAVMLHNFDVSLLSSDNFRPQVLNLDAQSAALFRGWQHGYQYAVEGWHNHTEPIFKEPARREPKEVHQYASTSTDFSEQHGIRSFHFPLTRSSSDEKIQQIWLCCKVQ